MTTNKQFLESIQSKIDWILENFSEENINKSLDWDMLCKFESELDFGGDELLKNIDK